MFKKIKEFFVGKSAVESKFEHPLDAVTTPNTSAPYKIPEPAATTPIPVVSDQLAVVNAAEGSAVKTVPEKKARKPRTPKAAPVAVVKEKAPAKAKAPKLTMVKTAKTTAARSKKA